MQIFLFLLWPLRVLLSLFYRAVMSLRNCYYDLGHGIHKVSCEVISVGNLTVGGTGKTPYVIHLIKQLQAEGKKVAILSRGYKGHKSSTQYCVSDGENIFMTVEEAGDEPFMMAKALPGVPIYVDSDRVTIAKMACDEHAVNVCILDDGFQHRRLHRDKDIVLWDATQDFVTAHILPWGYLRESKKGLRRANQVILTKIDLATVQDRQRNEDALQSYIKGEPLQKVSYRAVSWTRHPDGKVLDLDALRGNAYVVVCGLAQPQGFLRQLDMLGTVIVKEYLCSDHHLFSTKDISQIALLVQEVNAKGVVCTAKDAVRLPRETPFSVYILDIELVVV